MLIKLYINSNNIPYNMNLQSHKLWSYSNWAQLALLFAISFNLKMLLAPAYFSTDMDVHQNWLRITARKPLTQWYFDTQSKWTLDYPPLFAYFEWILSSISKFISPLISNTINQFKITVYFQRVTVMLSQIPYLLVLNWIFGGVTRKLAIAYFFIPFIILDNIHFQYNIIMQALFLLSIELMRRNRFLQAAFCYSFLLNFKHIYLYSSIAFFIYIIKEYILKESTNQQKLIKLTKVALATIIPFLVSFLPFLIMGGTAQITQIFSRLFPFQRGLIHEYWAPNFWALYYFADKALYYVFSKLGIQLISVKQMGQLHYLRILPQIPAILTTLIILLFTLPLIVKYFKSKTLKFQHLVFICGCIFFLFGFHVHEKAITPYIALLWVYLKTEDQSNSFIQSAIFVNIINLLPLMFSPNEKILRVILPLLWIAIWERKRQVQGVVQTITVTLGFFVIFFNQILHPLIFSQKMEFLPLMINSIYAASFNIFWIFFLYKKQLTLKHQEYTRVQTQIDN